MKNRRERGIARKIPTPVKNRLSFFPGGSLFSHRLTGRTNCVSGFALSGRQPVHRLNELPQACSPPNGREVLAEQRG